MVPLSCLPGTHFVALLLFIVHVQHIEQTATQTFGATSAEVLYQVRYRGVGLTAPQGAQLGVPFPTAGWAGY